MSKLTLLPDCARCGEAHADLEIKIFTRSSPVEGFDHFAICPNTQEPILIQKIEIINQDQKPKPGIPEAWIDKDTHFRAGEREETEGSK